MTGFQEALKRVDRVTAMLRAKERQFQRQRFYLVVAIITMSLWLAIDVWTLRDKIRVRGQRDRALQLLNARCNRVHTQLQAMHDHPGLDAWTSIDAELRECANGDPHGDSVDAWLRVVPERALDDQELIR